MADQQSTSAGVSSEKNSGPMAEVRLNISGLNMKRTQRSNICTQIFRSQVSGNGIKSHHIPTSLLERIDVMYDLDAIPMIIREIDMSLKEEKFDKTLFKLNLLDLQDLQSRNDSSPMGACHLINFFGGVEVILRMLFSAEIRPSKDLNKLYCSPRNTSATQLEMRTVCLDVLREVCVVVYGVATRISQYHDFIEYLFIMMEDKKTFAGASAFLENLLVSKKQFVELSRIQNLQSLVTSLKNDNFTRFCRIFSHVIEDINFSEEGNTLIAQDRDEEVLATEKSFADANQALLLSFPELLPRMAKLAGKSLASPLSRLTRSNMEHVFGNSVNVDAFLDNLDGLDIENDIPASSDDSSDDSLAESNNASILPRRLKYIHEVMSKVEILYVLTLFLNGKHKVQVQCKLGELKIIPALCDLFDELGWNMSSDRFPTHSHAESEGFEDTPENNLKIQFLRFITSFCDHSEKKHLLLSTVEVEEVHMICDKFNFDRPTGLDKTRSRCRCRGEKGLLSKIVNVLKRTTPNNELRFWLSRAVTGYLRGRVSPPDQHFLLNRDLVEHLLEHVLNSDTESKEILQSSFDLLGELMKFNENAFHRFTNFVITDSQFEKFVSTMTLYVEDSSMFSDLIGKWEHKG